VPDTLKSLLSTCEEKSPLERQLLMEFYRVATTQLPWNAHMSPDVSRVFGLEGYLDFYANGELQWLLNY
jgi:hypothetical protein